jgi:[acyl-carrier-protein] S-malonyltransferase
MSSIALVFPGQGAQAKGMGAELYREFAPARETFQEASAAISLDLSRLCFEDPDHRLDLTAFTQPAILTASLAAWRVLAAETGLTPLAAAGHSLGEYTALVAAGALPLADAVRAVHARGRAMQEAVPVGAGAMAAVLGLAPEAVAAVCAEAGQGEVVAAANDNAPGQIVISGHAAAVERALALVKARGGKGRKLKVSGPFHSPLMRPAAEAMAPILRGLPFRALAFPVIANFNAQAYESADRVAEGLLAQITAPVRWRESVEALDRMGTAAYIECGPGTVLAGLIQRVREDARVLPLSAPGHLAAIKEALHGG